MISDDADDDLLVRLFIAKLKLTYAKEKTEEQIVEELKQNIIKERDLLQ